MPHAAFVFLEGFRDVDTDVANQQVVLARIAAQVELIHDRFDQERRIADTRHADLVGRVATQHSEVVTRLDAINGRVRHAHERLSRHDAVIEGLQDAVTYMRKRMHDLANAAGVTPAQLRWLVAAFAAGAAGLVWLMEVIRK